MPDHVADFAESRHGLTRGFTQDITRGLTQAASQAASQAVTRAEHLRPAPHQLSRHAAKPPGQSSNSEHEGQPGLVLAP
ncbi:MAG TPA: hypothetical protein VE733_10065 [Streptosporangiaceae bacterium]|jgi:hypothetical protein|nr:hypothetical protein [Streptosporangiaceae bacterium]